LNYYYELKEDGTVFGEDLGRYVVMPDCSPANGGAMNYHLHDHLIRNSSRVWIENENGVSRADDRPVNTKEFIWIKLKAKAIK